jgi:uncharacterized 2Fe-2S/4Fe-4S cluster protein (DUF4445 family)
MTYALRILPEGRIVHAPSEEVLADVLGELGIGLNLYCGRRGLCGKCFVEIVKGERTAPGPEERVFLEKKNLPDNHRLACRYKIQSDLTVRIPEESLLPRMSVLTQGISRTIPLQPSVRKVSISLAKPEVAFPYSLLDLLCRRYPKIHPRMSSSNALRSLAQLQDRLEEGFTAVLYDEHEILCFEPGDTTGGAFGIALDLGTTTVVVELIDLNTGVSVDQTAGMNAQVKFGADVISRISAAFMEQKKLQELQSAIIESLNEMISSLLKRNRVPANSVYEAVVAGNAAMNHLFLGLPVKTLAVAPYNAVFSVLPAVPALETGLAISPNGKVYMAPNIKSFVGGDIAAGLAAVDLEHQEGKFLFIDLGTNGEIVLKKGKRLTATSTAAGPAFEGTTISCGMLALPGAVNRAEFKDHLEIETIGGRPARGVCGTGLIDIVAVSLEEGFLSSKGHILTPFKKINVTKNIFLNQKDIREIQLAAAAVKTGIQMLLAENHLAPKELDGIYVAGAFGNYLNIPNAMSIGLLPSIDRKRIFFVGNSSLAGAKALLLSQQERDRCEKLARKIRHLSLAKDAEFQKTFVKALEFKTWA